MNKIYLILLILVTLLSGIYIHHTIKQANPKHQTIKRSFLSDSQSQLTLTYDFKTDLITSETTGDLTHTQENIIHTTSRAKFTPVYHASTNTFTVLIDYDDITIVKLDPILDEEITQYTYEDESEEDIEILYIATIDADTGHLIGLTKTKGGQDDLVDQMTKMEIAQIFPDIRRIQPNLLGDALLEEQTELGVVNAHTNIYEVAGDDGQVLEKYYNEDDIKDKSSMQWANEGGAAAVEFQEVLLISNPEDMIVKTGKSTFDFVYEVDIEEKIQLRQTAQDGEDGETQDSGIDLVGDMVVHYDTELKIQEVEHKAEYFDHVQEIAKNVLEHEEMFEKVNAGIEQAEVLINDLSTEAPEYDGEVDEDQISEAEIDPEVLTLLYQSTPKYTKNYNVVSQRILGKRVMFQIQYRNYGEMSNVKGVIMLDSKVLKTLFSLNYKHCGGSKQKNVDKSFNQRLFKVTYPIAGIIRVSATADFTIGYGFAYKYGGMSQAHGCEISVSPYVKPGITVTGGVNAAIAKGGIYARGTIANTYLTFSSHVKGFIPKLSGGVSLAVIVKPFEFSVGAWYQMFKCSFKKIFRWRPKLRKACGYGSRKEIKIFSHGVGRQKTYQIFNYNWKL